MGKINSQRRCYLDHAASSPLREVAFSALTETARLGANPSALHTSG
ncbi:MAG: hypothetical protein Q3997_02300, partial [Propionibacteriaceae bacterium]|nr:hypothetical protein [Propionibacteriaceae bacterium]